MFAVNLRRTPVYGWYAKKDSRDQLVLKSLIYMSLALFCYSVIWVPLDNYSHTQKNRAAASQATADWLIANRNALAQRAAADGTVAGETTAPLTISRITKSAALYNVTLARLQPESDGSVSVALEQQPFDAVVTWLYGIENEQGYVIDRGSIDRSNEQGLVNGQFRFR
jgi:general secretion pathway protein M